MLTVDDFKAGDKVRWVGGVCVTEYKTLTPSRYYLELTSSGTVVKVTAKRVLVQWDKHKGRARFYLPYSLQKIVTSEP